MSALLGISAGDQFRMVGLPGERRTDPVLVLEVGSTTNTAELNCLITDIDAGERWLATIGAANLQACIEAGWYQRVTK